LASGLRTKVVDRVNEVVTSLKSQSKGGKVRVFVTGDALPTRSGLLLQHPESRCFCELKGLCAVDTALVGRPALGLISCT